MGGTGRNLCAIFIAMTILACGSAVEPGGFSDGSVAGMDSDSSGRTPLGTYELIFDGVVGELTMVPATHLSSLAGTLLFSRSAGEQLGQTIPVSDLFIGNGGTTVYDRGENSLTLESFSIANESSTSHHYLDFRMRFTLINPTSVTLSAPPAYSDGANGYYLDFQDIPFSEAVLGTLRPFKMVNPTGGNFRAAVFFDATLTTTEPTQYITTTNSTIWPVTVGPESVAVVGKNFGESATLYVDGNKVTCFQSSSPDQMTCADPSSLPAITGMMEIDTGSEMIPGPLILGATQGGMSLQLPTGSPVITSYLYVSVWDGAGTPVNGCPATSSLGNYDAESRQMTLNAVSTTYGTIVQNLAVSGSGFKIHVAFDTNRNSKLDNGDDYIYTTGNTITADILNSFPDAMPFATKITADCSAPAGD